LTIIIVFTGEKITEHNSVTQLLLFSSDFIDIKNFLNINKNVKQKKLKMKATLSTTSTLKYAHMIIF